MKENQCLKNVDLAVPLWGSVSNGVLVLNFISSQQNTTHFLIQQTFKTLKM